MSGKVIKEEKIETPFKGMEVTLTTTEYPQFKRRKKVIFCLAELEATQLGNLITVYHTKSRKSDWEPIKYVPLYYRVKLNADADVSEVEPYYEGIVEEKGEYDFKDKEKAIDFIEGLRYKGFSRGIYVDTKKEFERWKEALRQVRESEV